MTEPEAERPSAPQDEEKGMTTQAEKPRKAAKWLLTGPKLVVVLLLAVAVLITGLWASYAIYYSNLPGEMVRTIAAWAFGLGWLAAFLFRRGRLRTLVYYAIAFAGVLVWWLLIPASNDRIWTADTAYMPKATVDGNRVTISHIRNFDYRSEDDFDEVWETREYDLDKVQTLDFVLSDWGLRDIVHTMLSFGFEDGRYLCLSAETRREKGEPWAIIPGLFKQYELIYILADERDLLRLRTSFRKEDVYIYPTKTRPEGARRVLEEVIATINELVEKPKFYHTFTHNCTMGLLPLLDPIRQHREWDIRYLKNGLTAEMAYENDTLDTDLSYEELKKRAHANQYVADDPVALDFSERVRAWRKAQ